MGVAPGRPQNQPTLPNNNSGLCALALPDGTVVCGHNTSGISWGPRNELVLSASTDDGLTWERLRVIKKLADPGQGFHGEDDGVVTTGRGELSYPTVIADPDNTDRLLVSYTRERRAIVVADLEVNEMGTGRPEQGGVDPVPPALGVAGMPRSASPCAGCWTRGSRCRGSFAGGACGINPPPMRSCRRPV